MKVFIKKQLAALAKTILAWAEPPPAPPKAGPVPRTFKVGGLVFMVQDEAPGCYGPVMSVQDEHGVMVGFDFFEERLQVLVFEGDESSKLGGEPAVTVRFLPNGTVHSIYVEDALSERTRWDEDDFDAWCKLAVWPVNFRIWDGRYAKRFYDVLDKDGVLHKWCWPNAGHMDAIHDEGEEHPSWKPEDRILIRESLDHPVDEIAEVQ